MILYLLITVLTLLYFIITRKYNYWEKRNVAHTKPTFLLGNYGDLILRRKNFGETIADICKNWAGEKYIGAFNATEPVLIPIDPEIIKLIVTKNFYFFNGRELSNFSHKDAVSLNVFSSSGDNWKALRQNLTPLFTSAKMKNMFHLIEKCSYQFETMLDRETKISKEHEIRTFISKFTMECITECAFGVTSNTMDENQVENPFRKIAASFDTVKSFQTLLMFYIRLVRSVWPSLFYLFGIRLITKEMEFFHHMITSVMASRDYKSSGRHDFVDLIVNWYQNKEIISDSIKNAKTGGNEKISIPVNDDLLVAQCFIFFVAGFETSATTSSFTLYELAKHKEIQDRVLAEVDAYMARHNNHITYDCLTELPYLEACIDEALRLYPVLGMIQRETMEECELPGGLKVEKGMRIHLPVYYLHHNPDYFEDPEEFRPERFLGDAKKSIKPYTYMPFGEGPRICIGMRFAKMQMMAGLVTLLKKYRLELADGMSRKLSLNPQAFVTQAIGGIRLNLLERDGWETRVLAKK